LAPNGGSRIIAVAERSAVTMKNTLSIIAFLALAAAPALAVPSSPFAPLSPQQARANVGQNVMIEGTARVHPAPDRLGINIDLAGQGRRDDFIGFVPNENLRVFPRLAALDGRVVDITGVIQLRQGIPTIKLTSAYQLRSVH
jgi:hypothetical protein